MAHGCCKTVGAVEVFGKFFKAQELLEHFCDLLLTGCPIAGYGHLDLFGFVFGNGYLAGQAGCHGNALRTPQLEHRLHVFSEKGRFNGDLVGQVGVDKLYGTFEDEAQLYVMVVVLAEQQFIQLEEFHLFVHDLYQAETHNGRARIDA